MKQIILITLLLVTHITFAQATTTSFDWVQSFNTPDNFSIHEITKDNEGYIFLTGAFEGTVDIDPSETEEFVSSHIFSDGFIIKLTPMGELVWFRHIHEYDEFGDPIKYQYCTDIVTDHDGNLLITGYFFGEVDFDFGPGEDIRYSNGRNDAFLLKISSDGDLIWVQTFGFYGLDSGASLRVDDSNNIYLGGSFAGTVDFDNGPEVHSLTGVGAIDEVFGMNNDAFILKLSPEGNFLKVDHIGSENNVRISDMEIDNEGNLYVVGDFSGFTYFNPVLADITLETSPHYSHIFICKMNDEGNFLWAKQFGGSTMDNGRSIALDNTGAIYTTGGFSGEADFDPSDEEFLLTSVGGLDIYINKVSNDGDFIWAKHMKGDIEGEVGLNIEVDSASNIYLSGNIRESIDFDPSDEEHILTAIDDGIGFLQKLDSAGQLLWVETIARSANSGQFIIDEELSIYLTGSYMDTVDFDFSDELELRTAPEGAVYLLKLNHEFVGLPDLETIEELNLYPNPSSETLNIAYNGNLSIEIYNLQGQKVLSTINSKVDISHLNSGSYIVRITAVKNGNIWVKNFIKH